MSTMSVRATWLPPRRHPMLRTDNCHGVVGRERPRNGRRAPIADVLAVEIQLGIEIAPHLRMDAVESEQTNVSLPLCIAASAWATAGTCSARATASRPIEGERGKGAQQNGILCQSGHVHIRVPSGPSHQCVRMRDRRPAGRWESRVEAEGQLPE